MDPTQKGAPKRLIKNYLQSSSNIFAENKTLRFLFVGILGVTLMNTVSIQRMQDNTKTILMPVGHSVEYTFTGNTPSDNYLRDISLFIMHMAGDISAHNAASQFESLLALWHPSTVQEYRGIFRDISRELERYPSTSYDVTWNASQPIRLRPGEVRIHASKRKIVGDTITQTTTLQYIIEYTMESGKFSIVHLKEVGGDDI
jgi:conjugal transfer pilus assembly protein TraE